MREAIIDERTAGGPSQVASRLASDLGLGLDAAADLTALEASLRTQEDPCRIIVRHTDGNGASSPLAELEHGIEAAAQANSHIDLIEYLDDLAEDGEDSDAHMSAAEALGRLKQGNAEFVVSHHNGVDISKDLVKHLFEEGQHPFATVITCSDSRVAPEHIFMLGLGDIFVIRTAGNVVGTYEAASAFYAADHLHTRLLVVLGHTHCGAIESALGGQGHGVIAPLLERVSAAVGDEADPYAAAVLNVRQSVADLRGYPEIEALCASGQLEIVGAIYHTHEGEVDFLV